MGVDTGFPHSDFQYQVQICDFPTSKGLQIDLLSADADGFFIGEGAAE